MPANIKSTKTETAKPEVKAVAKDLPAATAAPAAKVAETKVAPIVKAVVVEAAASKDSVTKTEAVSPKIEAGRDRSAIVALIARLRDPEADNARDAAITLGSLPADAAAVDALIAVLRNTDHYFHPVVRTAAAQSLGKIGDRRAVDALIAATRDPMAEASEEAVKALGLLGDTRALAALNLAITNADSFYLEMVRKAAAEAIDRLKVAKA